MNYYLQQAQVVVLLVGGGPQERALREQVAAMGLSAQVVFTGRVPHAKVGMYYDLMDVLAYPRLPMRLTELVTPMKPLEAMAQGRLLIASDVGGHRELIEHERTGWLFKAGSKEALAQSLIALLGRRGQWQAVRDQARHFVETQRTWGASVARYLPVFEGLVGRAL